MVWNDCGINAFDRLQSFVSGVATQRKFMPFFHRVLTVTVFAAASLPTHALAQIESTEQDERVVPPAQESQFYGALSGGLNVQRDQKFAGILQSSPGGSGSATEINVGYKTGTAVRAAVGYRWKKGLIKWLKPRTEIEVSKTRSRINDGSLNGIAQNFGGSINTTTIKIGLASDIIWSKSQKIVPYFASGYGISMVDANIAYVAGNGQSFAIKDNRTRFAQHNAAGLSFVGDPKFNIYAEGRYSQNGKAKFDDRFAATGNSAGQVRARTTAFEFTVGTRVRF
jgi:opacity protein-like surface antigen